MTAQPAPNKADALAASKVAAANNRFGFRLFEEVSAKDAHGNLCVSPTSLALALGMTYNGASGTTKTAMAHALALNGMSLEQLNLGSRALMRSLATPPAVSAPTDARAGKAAPQLAIANSLWLRSEEALRRDFVQRTQQYYNAQVGSLAHAPQNINGWVGQHTQGKITQIVTRENVESASAVLVNAVYFKGQWENAFDKSQTTDKPFHRADGNIATCKLMTRSGDYAYYKADAFQMVSLPYQSSQLDMVIVLPNADTKLSAFLPQLTPEHWQQWTEKLSRHPGMVELPRFRAEYNVELSEALSTLGMGEAFGPRADFSAMSHTPQYISKVIHKTFVNVDEAGTEAAAATAVIMRPRGIFRPVVAPFQMTIDRPFLYAIRDRETGALLFVGTLAHP